MKDVLPLPVSFSARAHKQQMESSTRVGSVEDEKTPAQAEETECDDCSTVCQFPFFFAQIPQK